jgi:DNA-binding transcriptional ArsR family regulator
MNLTDSSNTGENELAVLCQTLAEPFRVRLLRLLAAGAERTVSQLCAAARACSARVVSQPMISHHLGVLRTCGLVACRHVGRWRYYALAACVRAEECALFIETGAASISLRFRGATSQDGPVGAD